MTRARSMRGDTRSLPEAEVLNELLHVQMIQINHDHFDECAVDDDADIIGVCQPAWLLHL